MTRQQLAETLILQAGEMLLAGFGKVEQINEKKAQDFVTEVDTSIETFLRNEIKKQFPEDGLMGEEYGEEAGTSGYTWIIDPLDGTNNFARAIPMNGNIIALLKDGEVVSGYINIPHFQELYYAHKGEGAFCRNLKTGDTEQIHVSNRTWENAMLVIDPFPDHRYYMEELPLHIAIHQEARNVRGFFCGAYHCALIASGKAEFNFNPTNHPWDIAAGCLLVEEAGGKVTDYKGNALQRYDKSMVMSNGVFHDKILLLITEHYKTEYFDLT